MPLLKTLNFGKRHTRFTTRMRITPKRVKNLSFLVVDNFFTDQELQEVVQEARYLKTFLLGPEKTNTAKDENNRLKKIGQGVFLDTFYEGKRENSKILKANRILFSKKICSVAEELDSVFTFIRYSNVDYTILNSYVEDGEYKAHHLAPRAILRRFQAEYPQLLFYAKETLQGESSNSHNKT